MSYVVRALNEVSSEAMEVWGENIMEGFTKVTSPKWRLDGCKLATGSRVGLETEAIAHMKAQRCE